MTDPAENTNNLDYPPLPASIPAKLLKTARKAARGMGLEYKSGRHAIELLRERGIDIMADGVADQLDGITSAGTETAPSTINDQNPETDEAPVNLPARIPETSSNLPAQPSTFGIGDPNQQLEIEKIHQSLMHRRRRRSFFLALRFLFFIGLPTFLSAYYYFVLATQMYETKSSVFIQSADAFGGGGGGIGGLFSGTAFATTQDSVAVQAFLQSRESAMRLNKEHGFAAEFQQDHVDDFKRLKKDATEEDIYKYYKSVVSVSYEPSDGIINMVVAAPSAERSHEFNEALMKYAEERVDQMSLRIREDHVAESQKAYKNAEIEVQKASQHILELQEDAKFINGEIELQLLTTRITSLERQLEERIMQRSQLMTNQQPNKVRLDAINGDIALLEERISTLREQIIEGSDGRAAVNKINAELEIAKLNLMTRQTVLQQALASYEAANLEANRQVRYLSVSVAPVAPDKPTYPKRYENTIIAFLIFCGIYLIMSLTVAILREQLSA